jgi:protein-disulfide isomerase
MKTPIALVLAVLAFAAGFFVGQRQTLDAALGERLSAIETKLADLEKARPAAAARPNEPKPLAPAEAMKLIALDGAPARGAEKGQVTIVEYGDFQCPFCLRSRPTIQQVMQAYPAQVKVVYKHFPLSFHREAMNAHRAAEAAREQGKFWEMHDRIFQTPSDLTPETMRKHAEALGLDLAKFDEAYKSERVQKRIAADQDEGRKVGVRGTPAFFVNGKYIAGAQPFDAFKREIDAALGKATG